MTQHQTGMAPEEILCALGLKGWGYIDVDRAYSLIEGTARKTARYPHQNGELAIAEVLGLPPCQIWPERYDLSGLRLNPQPSANYIPRKSIRHCQKREAV